MGGPVETACQESVEVRIERLYPGFRYGNSGANGQLVRNLLPGAKIAVISATRKLGDPQMSLLVNYAGLGSCAAQRASRRNQHSEPSRVLVVLLRFITFQL